MLHKPREIYLHTKSSTHRLLGDQAPPNSLSHPIKPFLSLEVFRVGDKLALDVPLESSDSATAIVIYLLSGEAVFSDSTQKRGNLKEGDTLWMLAGSGIQYSLTPKTLDCVGVRLRLALSPALECAPAQSIQLPSILVESDGPSRLLLGQHGDASSQLALPALVNYAVVRLSAGQSWTYKPPVNHQVAWAAVIGGAIQTSDLLVAAGDVVSYENSNTSITFLAVEESVFFLGTSEQCATRERTKDFSIADHLNLSFKESFNPKWSEAFVLYS